MKFFKMGCLLLSLMVSGSGIIAADCVSCQAEQQLKFNLRGVGRMAGTATVTISYGSTVQTVVMTGGSVVFNTGTQRYEVETYECVQWAGDIAVEPKCNEPVSIKYDFEQDDANPAYTEFEFLEGELNPVIYWTRPSSRCLKVYMDNGDDQWVLEPLVFVGTPGTATPVRMKGVLQSDDSNAGDSAGPMAGLKTPMPDASELIDAPAVGDLSDRCPTGGAGFAFSAAAASSAKDTTTATAKATGTSSAPTAPKSRGAGKKGGKADLGKPGSGLAMKPTEWRFDKTRVKTVAAKEPKGAKDVTDAKAAKADESGAATPQTAPLVFSAASASGYTIAMPIGQLHWDMSLGSVDRSVALGSLDYQAEVLDGTAYLPARLSLTSGNDAKRVISDANGLRQIELPQRLVDIQIITNLTSTNGFLVAIYDKAQIGPYNVSTGLFPTTGMPLLTWTVQNPDATPIGRITFTKTEGTNSELHQAEWQGTNSVAGTMTITRFGGKWKDVTEYSLVSTNRRVQIISQFKNNVLQHKSRDLYQEFFNWGDPGEVFEAVIEHVEDPDGQGLVSTFTYWDQASQPGNLLYLATYPDGYSERTPTRLSGSGFEPAASSGSPLRTDRPYRDNEATSAAARVTESLYTQLSGTLLLEETATTINGETVGFRERYHSFENEGVWGIITIDYTDETGAYTQEEEWMEVSSRRVLFTLDRQGRTRTYTRTPGYWNPSTGSFSSSGPVAAIQTTIINGIVGSENGIPDKTTIEVTVEDTLGRVVLEESYVNTGSGVVPSARIDRKVHTYLDGLLTATHRNGRLIYEAGHNADGKVEWEKDETGRQTEYTYDEMERVYQKTVKGRSGDADRVTTYEYDVYGNVTSETTTAGSLTVQVQSSYNLAGEMVATIGVDGLTNSFSTSYDVVKTVTETLPNQATRITDFYRDRQVYSVKGTAAEDEYHDPFIALWTVNPEPFYHEAVAVYRDSAMTQLKGLRVVNWVGSEELIQTPRFQNAGYRHRYTYYDVDGQGKSRQLPIAVTETGRATRLFSYDSLARITAQGQDLNSNGMLDASSADPITSFSRQFVNTNGLWQDVSEVLRYLQDNMAAATLVQRARVVVPAALSTSVVSSNIVERTGGGAVITTVALNLTTGELTTSVNDQELGQVQSRVQRDGVVRSETKPGISIPRTYTYTALGELLTVSDPVTGNVTNSYDAATRRLENVADSLNRTTAYDYYPAGGANAGRVKGIQDAAGNWTYFDYNPEGQLFRRWGVNIYPVEHRYDEVGRRTNLMTFRTSGGSVNWASPIWPNPPTGDMTQWVYDQPSGLLERKIYSDTGTGPKNVIHSYDSANLPDTKINGRGQTIDYSFDTLGRLTNLVYSDGTPSATITYDRAGRLRTVTDASGTRNISWTERDQAGEESYSSGLLSGLAMTRGYDAQSRLLMLGVSVGGTPMIRQRFAYDGISWLDYITDETPDGASVLHKFDYTFKTNTPFVESITFARSATMVMTQSYSRDSLGRLAGASARLTSGASASGVSYQFDNLDRRFEASRADGTKWNYGYNDRSEVTSGKKELALGANAGGEQFEYLFDNIGNRMSTKAGGDAAGNNLRAAAYSANALNQLASREVPGSVWLTGEAPTNLALQGVANGLGFALQRQAGEQYFGEAAVDNLSGAAYARLTVAGKTNGVLSDVETGHHFVARTPESFTYDDDGNLTQDGRWSYTWDAENRLASVTAREDIPEAAKRKLEFVYDFLGRRVRQTTYTGSSGSYVVAEDLKFVSDGWRNLAELNATNNLLVRSYSWGLDVSGTLGGAGGVGGLLLIKSAQNGAHFYAMDGNGNAMALVNAADGTVSANYDYDPYGVTLRVTGPMALENPFRFSTKRANDSIGLVLYEHRAYRPDLGRWLSLDPIGEQGGANLYGFVYNSGVNSFDPFGLAWYDWPDDLANWAQSQHGQFSTAMNGVSGDGVNWIIVGSLNSVSELTAGILSLPNAIGHLGEATGATGYIGDEPLFQPIANLGSGSGAFCENPSWETAPGALMDLSVTASILAPFAPTKGRVIYVEPNGQLVFPYYANMSPAALSLLRRSPVIGVEGADSLLAQQRLAQLELDLEKALCNCGANSAIQARNLARQLTSEEQMSQAFAGKGEPIFGAGTGEPLTSANRLAQQYGGNPADWAKMGGENSAIHGTTTPAGNNFEIHWYQNVKTGQIVELKTKVSGH